MRAAASIALAGLALAGSMPLLQRLAANTSTRLGLPEAASTDGFVAINNGAPSTELPAVACVLIDGEFAATASLCGRKNGRDIFLTAGHVVDVIPARPGQEERSGAICIAPDCRKCAAGQSYVVQSFARYSSNDYDPMDINFDLGVLYVNGPTKAVGDDGRLRDLKPMPVSFAPLDTKAYPRAVELLGYGDDLAVSRQLMGTKKTGSNRLKQGSSAAFFHKTIDHLERLRRRGGMSIYNGDSGSPLLVKDGNDRTIFGVYFASLLHDNSVDVSEAVNIYRPGARSFVSEHCLGTPRGQDTNLYCQGLRDCAMVGTTGRALRYRNADARVQYNIGGSFSGRSDNGPLTWASTAAGMENETTRAIREDVSSKGYRADEFLIKGFSLGAWDALRLATKDGVKQVVAVAPPTIALHELAMAVVSSLGRVVKGKDITVVLSKSDPISTGAGLWLPVLKQAGIKIIITDTGAFGRNPHEVWQYCLQAPAACW